MNAQNKDWLRFGECVELAAGKGISRKVFLKLLAAKGPHPTIENEEVFLIERRIFEGCGRRHYGRVSLMKVLQTETKP
jgi:hypothetical protein